MKKPENLVLTPHGGEFNRLSGDAEPDEWSKKNPGTLVLKGAHTQIFSEENQIYCLGGSAALARGGSGDLLAGMMGALLRERNIFKFGCCLFGRAVAWAGG